MTILEDAWHDRFNRDVGELESRRHDLEPAGPRGGQRAPAVYARPHAAARLEPDYGPAMRKLLQDIDRLQRLTALPLAA